MKKAFIIHLTLSLAALAIRAEATQIDASLWEEMAVTCDFAGVVECIKAGGIVAEYRVLEAWKGPEPAEPIRILTSVNYWEPQFPMTLIGQRYLVFGYKNNAPVRMVSATVGTTVPLWWRRIEPDYSVPLFQGRYLIDTNGKITSGDFGYSSEHPNSKTVAAIKEEVVQLTGALTKRQQEVVLLGKLFEKYFLGKYQEQLKSNLYSLSGYENAINAAEHKEYIQSLKESIKQSETRISRIEPVHDEVRNCADPNRLIDIIYDLSLMDFQEYRDGFRSVFWYGIQTKEGLHHLRKRMAGTDPSAFDETTWRYTCEMIERRIEPAVPTLNPPEPNPATYTATELEKHRAIVRDYSKRQFQWDQSFEILVEQDPVWTAQWLSKWKNPRSQWHDEARGYEMGSHLACRASRERVRCLEILVKAKDADVRVAGAVYLCFEDEKQGMKYLRKFSDYKGHAGRWAALNLARRGDKGVVRGLIKSYDNFDFQTGQMKSVPVSNLAKRLMVLLSNSAAGSGVPQPPDLTQSKSVDALVAWWNKHEERIALHDPWLDILRAQKID